MVFLEATWQAPVGDKAERSPELSPGQNHGVLVIETPKTCCFGELGDLCDSGRDVHPHPLKMGTFVVGSV